MDFFCSFSECPDTEQISEQQVLRARFLGLISIFYQQSDAGIEPGTAG